MLSAIFQQGGRTAAVSSCPGYNSLGQSGDKARSTPLEAQSARGGGRTCGHGLVGKDVVRPGDDENKKNGRLEDRRVTDHVSMQQGGSILIAEPREA